MTPVEVFAWGVAGSLAIEVAAVARHYDDGKLALPRRYYRFGFYVFRVLLAVAAGGLAVAYDVASSISALHIGAATPLILKALGESIPVTPRQSVESPET